MNKSEQRFNALLPGGQPRYIRCYDNQGKSADRYTVVFTGRYTQKTGGEHWYLGMNTAPFHGIGQHGASTTQIDYPSYGHLGNKIKFSDLNSECQQCVLQTYLYLWDITDEHGHWMKPYQPFKDKILSNNQPMKPKPEPGKWY